MSIFHFLVSLVEDFLPFLFHGLSVALHWPKKTADFLVYMGASHLGVYFLLIIPRITGKVNSEIDSAGGTMDHVLFPRWVTLSPGFGQ